MFTPGPGAFTAQTEEVPQRLRRVSHPTRTSLLENVEGNSGPFEDDFPRCDNWLKMTLFIYLLTDDGKAGCCRVRKAGFPHQADG